MSVAGHIFTPDGIERVQLTLGDHTPDAPYYVHAEPSSILVGQNLVSAFTPKGSGIISIDKTIEALGYTQVIRKTVWK